MRKIRVWAAGIALGCLSFPLSNSGMASEFASDHVTVAWMPHGIPHITARDFRGLGFGTGYAYARYNACLLLDTVITVNGERSRYFGADGEAAPGFQTVSNLDSDVFFRGYFDPNALESEYRKHHARAWQLISGYAAGVNSFLGSANAAEQMASCKGKPWVHPVTPRDIMMVIAQKSVLTSGSAFAGAFASASPPDAPSRANDRSAAPETADKHVGSVGSNAYAFGSDVTQAHTGILVGNPHFPWNGPNRFFELRQTIPGQFDVRGAALGGFPLVNIGYNNDVAWSHTVSTGQRFTIFRLALVPGHPDQYLVDGKAEIMDRRAITVPVLTSAGTVVSQTRTVFWTRFGAVVVAKGRGLQWDDKQAFALGDSERDNTRLIDQWLRIGTATSSTDLLAGLKEVHGLPWVNTVAADRSGTILMADESIVPAVTVSPDNHCILRGAAGGGPLVMDGSHSACDWTTAPPLSTDLMPAALRKDYVFNSNDPAWAFNKNGRMANVPPIVGMMGKPLRPRSRMSILAVEDRLKVDHSALTMDEAANIVLDDRNYAATLVQPALAALCRGAEQRTIDQDGACDALKKWDGRDTPQSEGAVLFREFWQKARNIPDLWSVAFTPDDLPDTPGTLAVTNPRVRQALLDALGAAAQKLQSLHFPLSVPLAAVQYRETPRGKVAVPGGREFEGTLNIAGFGALGADGYGHADIVGTSYLQVVSWEKGLPEARAILTYGQSAETNLPEYEDQTELYARSQLLRQPFDQPVISTEHLQVPSH